jgi:phospholipid/cholesterol/gamma-HCH transport system ATP-binding protein
VLGEDLTALAAAPGLALRKRWGVMFQRGGLFGALTVRQNVGLPLREHSALDDTLIDRIAEWKLALTGLPPEAGLKRPSELSGGMLKRAALARALIMDPPLLLLDEPTAGLDPGSADEFCALLQSLHQELGLTVVMVTHDLNTLLELSTRIAVVADRHIVADGSAAEVMAHPHPFIKEFFLGERGRRASALLQEPLYAPSSLLPNTKT